MTKRQNDKKRPARLCPLNGFKPCVMDACMLWDDDWMICGLNPGSMYSSVRSAVCDAAVEVATHYPRGEKT